MDDRPVTIAAVRWVGERTIAIELATPEDIDPRPGQFFLVRATVDGEEFARHYTMSSRDAAETFELTVGVDAEGVLSPWLATLEPGDRLRLSGPFGRIYYDDEPISAVLAGGPGVGAGLGVAERAVSDGNETALIAHVGDGDIPHEDRLARLAAGGVPTRVCRDETSIESAVAAIEESLAEPQWFVFGFKPFVELARIAIDTAGGAADMAKIENYG